MMTGATSFAKNLGSVIPPADAFGGIAQDSRRRFYGISGLLFLASAVATVLWSNSMAGTGTMSMRGGQTMSMVWMRMPGQTWAGTTASFAVMWTVMMVAMMLPSVAPMLWRYRESVGVCRNPDRLAALAGLGYFFAWMLFGLAVFPVGAAIAMVAMEEPTLARTVPILAGLAVLVCGTLQFTPWKAHHLRYCRAGPERDCVMPANAGAAWRQGLHFGMHCGLSCANLTAVLLVIGIMDLRAMAAVTASITIERLAPSGTRAAQMIGTVAAGTGLFLILKTVRFGL